MSCEQRVWNVITYIVDFALQCDISVEHTYTCTCTNVCMYLLLSTMLELDHDILSLLTFLGHVKGKSRVLASIPFVFLSRADTGVLSVHNDAGYP